MPEVVLSEWAEQKAAAVRRLPAIAQRQLTAELDLLLSRAKVGARGRIAASLRSRMEKGRAVLMMPRMFAPQEFGATIRPKKGQFLAVPVAPSARSFRGPREDGDLFVLQLRDGRRFLARKSGGIDLRWRLVSQVKIKGRHFVRTAMAQARVGFPRDVLDRMSAEVLSG